MNDPRLIYSVLDDALLPGGTECLIFLAFAVLWTVFWVVLNRVIERHTGQPRKVLGGVVVGIILCAAGVLQVATVTYPLYVDQRRCKEWLQSGEFETVEGPVESFSREAGKYPATRFHVNDVLFRYWTFQPCTGGFHGEFTDPSAQKLKLRDGLQVRVAHREGRILQIEVAE